MALFQTHHRRIAGFQRRLVNWHRHCARQDPWRWQATPFQVLVSQMLLTRQGLQRTWMVYEELVRETSEDSDLLKVSKTELLGRLKSSAYVTLLRDVAKELVRRNVEQPSGNAEQLLSLPGVGTQTASLTLAIAFDKASVVACSSTDRVFSRYFGGVSGPLCDASLHHVRNSLFSGDDAAKMQIAVKDLADTVCTTKHPKCGSCPLKTACCAGADRNEPQPKCLDLYSGAGGLSIAVRNAGAVIVSAVEHDKRAAQTYEYNFAGVPVAKASLSASRIIDLCRDLGHARNSLDLLVAGPPCQGFSISNLRTRNSQNPDNSAWRVVLACIDELRPRGVVMENVGGMETFGDGNVVSEILESLRSLGYSAKVYRLDAAHFGVPQRRSRLFFAGVRGGSLPESITPKSASATTVAAAIGDLPFLENGNETNAMSYRVHGAAITSYQSRMRCRTNGVVQNCRTSKSTPLIVKRFASVPQGGNWSDIPSRLFTNYAKPENCHRWLYRRLSESEPAVTISNFRKNMLIHPWEDRTLSIREAARLQAIPDDFVFFGNLQSQQQQVANAVPPPMGEAVIRIVLNALRKQNGTGR